MQKITILVSLLCTTYTFNMLSMNASTPFTARNLQVSERWVVELSSGTINAKRGEKITLDKTNFIDKPRRVNEPQCLFCERFLNEPNIVPKCDACRDTKINVILAQRFITKNQ